jgi:succinoglycan biosynthesis transport protein ExoP
VLTSAAQGAGVSTLAACLARTIAMAGDKVLLIGGDPGLPIAQAGPTQEAISGQIDIDDALRRDDRTDLCILPWHLADNADPARVIDAVRGHFAWILIDASGGPGTVDPAKLAAIADLILVAATRLLADRLSGGRGIACAVLTQVDMRRQVKYVHGDVANYYGKLAKYYS